MTQLLRQLLLCCLLLAYLTAGAKTDKSTAEVATMSAEQYNELTRDKAFDYKNETEVHKVPVSRKPGLFQAALLKFLTLFMGGAGSVLVWTVLIALLLYIVYRLVTMKGSFLFGRSKKVISDNGPPDGDEEDVANTNWEQLLQQALHNNDTRLAVRYYYMWLLQLLQNSNLIRYRNDKTNFDYYSELSNTSLRLPFKQLSRMYEYAWYGNFTLSSGAFSEYRSQFDHLKNQLSR